MDAEERRAIEATLRRFAARIDEVLFAAEGADGDLGRIPQLLGESREMDIVADSAPDAPGYELGVWGQHFQEEGLALSLLTLSLLSEACAGFAAAVHAQGLACLASGAQANCPPATPVAAAYTPSYGIPLGARMQSEGSGLRLTGRGDALELSGTAHFLLACAEPQTLICFAQSPGDDGAGPEWVALAVDAATAGLELTEVTGRTGLRAVYQAHLHCGQTVISADQVLSSGQAALRSLQRVIACDWLGQAAIGLGIARRTLRDSRAYTAQRYQGGSIIEEHAGIQLLQGTAEYDIALLTAILYQHAGQPLSSIELSVLLRWAVGAKLAIVEHAHRAVTHCLQTLGGYGYMEDYGFEKRLRDVSTLKSLHGAPDQLKLFLNELARVEEGG
jgi:alkylation response protein AidB-like acyl-CoA dehydrogenase